MKTKIKSVTAKDLIMHYLGIGLIGISTLIFLLPEWGIGRSDGPMFGVFWLNYALVLLYFVALLSFGHNFFKRTQQNIERVYLLLVLAIISCYSLNRDMNIFHDSAPWLEVSVTVFCGALMLYSFQERLPRLVNQLLLFILGTGSVLWLYYAVYLIPFYIIGIFGLILLGLSIHAYIPLLVVICLGIGVSKAAVSDRQYVRSFFAGAAFPVLFAVFFIVQWSSRDKQISFYNNDYVIQENETLPRWVSLSQQLPANYITERLMKTDLVYQVPSEGFSIWEMPTDNFAEVKRHDPLVMLAVFFMGKPDLDRQEKVKILESMYDARHQAEQRLWSGNNLATANVVSQVKIYPQYRLAYTEKVLSVRNNMPHNRNEQEAIYTFFLPEGSVVTSLSLWIDGREEKGYLTTKSKAHTAYNTIVGRERRDPSVVHWQEGNRVSVRVFPCTPQENRQFKIGVTSPLRQEGQELVYDNVYFTGPSSKGASETSMVYLEDRVSNLNLPFGYEKLYSTKYKREGSYQQDWSIRFKAPKLASGNFSFGGNSYQMVALPQQLTSFTPQRVYLDLNSSWSESDFREVWALVKRHKVYAWDGQMRQLTEDNKDEIFKQFQLQHYSLFPLHKIKSPEEALVISKSNGASPNLSDLKDTPFAKEMADAFQLQTPVRVYSLSEALSPYFKSLKELRVIATMQGNSYFLASLLQQQRFVKTALDQNIVRLGASGLGIVKTTASLAEDAPDHLLRLFAYNHLLQQIGPRYFCKNYLEDELIAEASQANIVSPVSSLIVLETHADYERFDIQKSKDSLGNASMNKSGAVPEPEEWALIILAVLIIGAITLKPYLLQ